MTKAQEHWELIQRVDRALDLIERWVVVMERVPASPAGARKAPPATSTGPAPGCPDCDAPMKVRRRRSDGEPFWGCSEYPDCTGIVNIGEEPAPRQEQLFANDDDLPF